MIGGAETYALLMKDADRLEITEVHLRPKGDTVFPSLDTALWEEVARVRNPAGPDDSVTSVHSRASVATTWHGSGASSRR